MQAYRLCDVSYRLKNRGSDMGGGKGSLWKSPESILIRADNKWLYLPDDRIVDASIFRDRLNIILENESSVELRAKNFYMLKALYHYVEGVVWKRELPE